MRRSIGRDNAEYARKFMENHYVIRVLDDLERIRHAVGVRADDRHAIGERSGIIRWTDYDVLFHSRFELGSEFPQGAGPPDSKVVDSGEVGPAVGRPRDSPGRGRRNAFHRSGPRDRHGYFLRHLTI